MVDNPRWFLFAIFGLAITLGVVLASFRLFFGGDSLETESATSTPDTVVSGEATTSSLSPSRETPKGEVSGPAAYDMVINYTESGFIPGTVEIKAGTSIRFMNKSNNPMWISAVNNPGDPYYSDFNQSKSLSKGGTFDFNFSRKGVWLYHNLNDTSKTGIIVVK